MIFETYLTFLVWVDYQKLLLAIVRQDNFPFHNYSNFKGPHKKQFQTKPKKEAR